MLIYQTNESHFITSVIWFLRFSRPECRGVSLYWGSVLVDEANVIILLFRENKSICHRYSCSVMVSNFQFSTSKSRWQLLFVILKSPKLRDSLKLLIRIISGKEWLQNDRQDMLYKMKERWFCFPETGLFWEELLLYPVTRSHSGCFDIRLQDVDKENVLQRGDTGCYRDECELSVSPDPLTQTQTSVWKWHQPAFIFWPETVIPVFKTFKF